MIKCRRDGCDNEAGMYGIGTRLKQRVYCCRRCLDITTQDRAKVATRENAKKRALTGGVLGRKNTKEEALSKLAKGERADWYGGEVEPDGWVDRALAKVDIDDRKTISRCPSCGCRIRKLTAISDDGKVYCDQLCYNIRLTEEMVRFHTNPEPAVYLQLLRSKP